MTRSTFTASPVVLLALLLALLSAPQQADAWWWKRHNTKAPDTIASVASSVDVLSTLVAAVKASPKVLKAASDPNTAVTVFAPTDKAFTKALEQLGMTATELLADTQTLTNILEYHIVPSVVKSSAATSTSVMVDTLLPTAQVSFVKNGASVLVNDAKVITADVVAGKSIVHVIDHVLLPPAVPTIASTAEENSALLSTLLAAVKASPSILAAAIDPHTEVTVFAPTNEAFTAALANLGLTAEQLLADEPTLTRILSYHIVKGVVPASAATAAVKNLDTLLPGGSVAVKLDGSDVMVNDAKVVAADVKAGLSLVHVIDAVLLPPDIPTIAEVAAENSAILSTLLAAVKASPTILAAATDASTQVTVFAPTNKAFENALSDLGISAADLLAKTDLLTKILAYHIVPKVIEAKDVPTQRTHVPTLLGQNLAVQATSSGVHINDATVVVPDVDAGASIVHVIDEVLLPDIHELNQMRIKNWWKCLFRWGHC